MPENPDNNLEKWLRTDEPYLESKHFAPEVIAQLPPRINRRLRRRLVKATVALASFAAGGAVVSTNPALLHRWEMLQPSTMLLTLGTIGLSSLVAAACTWIAIDRA